MSILYVTEYADAKGTIPKEPAITTQAVSFTGTHGESSALNPSTALVRLQADGICSVIFGTAPTATTSHRRMTAGQTEWFTVSPNTALKVSAVTNT